jgi:hypothetical protein
MLDASAQHSRAISMAAIKELGQICSDVFSTLSDSFSTLENVTRFLTEEVSKIHSDAIETEHYFRQGIEGCTSLPVVTYGSE